MPEHNPQLPNHRKITCGGCDKVWTGVTYCHCSACHETFGGIVGFDMHRKLNQKTDRGYCVNPASLGMTEINGIWVRRIERKHPQANI